MKKGFIKDMLKYPIPWIFLAIIILLEILAVIFYFIRK